MNFEDKLYDTLASISCKIPNKVMMQQGAAFVSIVSVMTSCFLKFFSV